MKKNCNNDTKNAQNVKVKTLQGSHFVFNIKLWMDASIALKLGHGLLG